ncbi:MAG: protein kinase [Alphaproteobacteria bacterium]|nr:protein kinase [Alphaproteobacteria bacterium]
MNTVSLGRFDLVEPIAAGGMGVVWRAVHRTDGTQVAMKVLTPNAADREDFIYALKEEIRAVAGLNHPHIIWIHDHGEVSREAAEASEGMLAEGGPWLALELCEGNTLRELAPKLDWEGIRDVLLDLLDALAHAHAHGILHRDIKLANVLVGGSRPGIKLTDFGITYAMESRQGAAPVNAGTPAYMAPEQLLGWGDQQGPWTDLYQFGVMAWKLITWGCPAEGDVRELMIAKNAEEWVPFKPVVPVPKGVEAWLMRLLKRWPEERFRCAADAAYALKQLGPAPLGERRLSFELWDADSTTIMGDPSVLDEFFDSQAPPEVATPVVPAPLPRDWREVETDATLPASLIGAGLNLFGLRKVPVIGREAERDALWAGFASVHRSRTPRVVVLRGPVGSGKTHVADWMCRKAEEVGGGIALRGSYARDGGVLQGVEEAIAKHLKCLGATRAEVEQRVDAAFDRFGDGDDDEARHLVALLHPEDDEEEVGGDGQRVQFRNRTERHELMARYLDRLTRERPVILFLDDVHHGRDGVRFARHLLRRGPSAVLLLLTVRDDVLARSKADYERLKSVEARSACASVYVGPISKEHRGEFVQRLLSIEPSLARQIADKTGGNPSFAAQLLADWVERGLLVASPTGFRLRDEGMQLPMPEDLHDPWNIRIRRLLRGHDDWRAALEIAATLGLRVHTGEWTKVCKLAGVPFSRRLLTAMLQNRYIVMDEASRGRSWSFAHSMFREAVLKEAEEAGRLQDHHAACVEVLKDATGGRRMARLAWHMLQAGETLEVIDPLLSGAEACLSDGDHEEATRLLEARERVMVDEQVRPSDTRWGRGWLVRARLHLREGEWKDAESWTQKTIDSAKDWGWRDLEIEALALMAGNMRFSDAHTANDYLARARQLLGEGVSARSRTTVSLLSADLARESGKLDEAAAWGRKALGYARMDGGEFVQECLRALIRVELERGNHRKALGLVVEAERVAKSAGSRYDLAQAAFLRAHIQRVRGNLGAAEDALEDAWQLSQAIADPNRMVVKASKGLLLVERGRYQRAVAEFRTCLRSNVRQAHLWSHLGMLVCAADDTDDTLWAAHIEPIARYLDRGWSDPTIARYARLAEERATAAGFQERAEDARVMADLQQMRTGARSE